MKRFITILSCLIVAMMAMSCGSKVEKDIKVFTADEFKILDVKSLDINKDFYLYTNEYAEAVQGFEDANDKALDLAGNLGRSEALYEIYGGESYKRAYNEAQKLYDEADSKCDEYASIAQGLQDKLKTGKIYVAKLKGKDEYTGKYLDFNSYQIFSYDSDGSLHPIEADNTIQLVCSVYPKAKEDLQKAMERVQEMMLDAFSNMDI